MFSRPNGYGTFTGNVPVDNEPSDSTLPLRRKQHNVLEHICMMAGAIGVSPVPTDMELRVLRAAVQVLVVLVVSAYV